ncbi:MAG TPA: hypothetical protein VL172_17255 [Kofleriaceae bacterium]|nr:hypothetical protein [Kofleriaceae bacterium]
MTGKATLLALVVGGALLGARPAPARAQDIGESDGCDEEEGDGTSPAAKDDAGSFRKIEKNGQVTYEYTGVIRVCGKVPKPNVVVILLERTVDYEWERLKQDFLPRIHDSLQRDPF